MIMMLRSSSLAVPVVLLQMQNSLKLLCYLYRASPWVRTCVCAQSKDTLNLDQWWDRLIAELNISAGLIYRSIYKSLKYFSLLCINPRLLSKQQLMIVCTVYNCLFELAVWDKTNIRGGTIEVEKQRFNSRIFTFTNNLLTKKSTTNHVILFIGLIK